MHRVSMRQPLLVSFVALLLALLAPGVTLAQTTTPDLVVTLRDAAGASLAGLTVQVWAAADGPILAHGVTDAHGQATFAGLTVDQVRVTVSGALPDGTPLVHPGRDAAGITVFLGPPPTRLDLRVDPHGLIQPDPVTMIDPLPNGPAIATQPAVAPQAGPSMRPTTAFTLATPTPAPRLAGTSFAGAAPYPPVSRAAAPAAIASPTATALSLLGWLAIGAVVAGAVLVFAVMRGRRV